MDLYDHSPLSLKERVQKIFRSYSFKEQVFLSILAVVALGSLLSIGSKIIDKTTVPVPAYGGTMTEGIVGVPHFINPLLAVSDADSDLARLVFSGLTRKKNDGSYVPDLAESISVSSDGLIYTATLKKNLYFHDGQKITADDILFTIKLAQDGNIKSPAKVLWDGVTVEKVDNVTIKFSLKQAYPDFEDILTTGILPKHIWGNIPAEQFSLQEHNIEAIGSGPYKIKKITKDGSGSPTQITLESFNRFSLGKPYINEITLSFFPNEKEMINAYNKGSITNIGAVSPENAQILSKKAGRSLNHAPLSRVFSVFFNQSEAPVLAQSDVRQALDMAINKEELVKEVLRGYGTELDGPTTEDVWKNHGNTIAEVKTFLEKNGWVMTDGVYKKDTSTKVKGKKVTSSLTLSFSLATSDEPELKAAALFIQKKWTELGARVELKIFAQGDLKQNVIRPRKFDSLLFGQIIDHESDLYAFWHSSQKTDPGLNIATYVNPSVDTLLTNARIEEDIMKREQDYEKIRETIKNDKPAIFLYAPEYTYIHDEKIQGITLGLLSRSQDRFNDVYHWYKEQDHVWKIFAPKS